MPVVVYGKANYRGSKRTKRFFLSLSRCSAMYRRARERENREIFQREFTRGG